MSVHTCKYIRGSRINVGFIIYEELSLLNTAVTLIRDLSTIPESIAVILDLSASFDTVGHDLLLEVLDKRFGVTNSTKQWYCSYINQGNSRVIIGKNKSEPRQLKCAVPQGSIQGAFLFISYASTLNEIVKDLTFKWLC